jgi:hypothetical protein
MAKLVLECSICQSRETREATEQQVRSLRQLGAAFFSCQICRRDTFWNYAGHERAAGREGRESVAIQGQPEAPRSPRGPRRVPLAIPVRVRGVGWRAAQEVSVTLDIGCGGICFHASNQFRIGEEVRVALHYSASSPESAIEKAGEVVRVNPIHGKTGRAVAIKYL